MRVYNGCPDSDLQRLIDQKKEIIKNVRQIEPEARCTYHNPDGYVIHVWGREISRYHSTSLAAWSDALGNEGGK